MKKWGVHDEGNEISLWFSARNTVLRVRWHSVNLPQERVYSHEYTMDNLPWMYQPLGTGGLWYFSNIGCTGSVYYPGAGSTMCLYIYLMGNSAHVMWSWGSHVVEPLLCWLWLEWVTLLVKFSKFPEYFSSLSHSKGKMDERWMTWTRKTF